MSKITVEAVGKSFKVSVVEGGSSTTHQVSFDDQYYSQLKIEGISKEKCIEAAFAFLLDREPKESILRKFDLTVIRQYFPNFESKFKEYLP